jgi:Tol biopolymer transport system component
MAIKSAYWILVPTALVLAACHGGDSEHGLGSHCKQNSECRLGLLCGFGRCRASCDRDGDCADGACVTTPDGNEVCTVQGETCAEGLAADQEGICRNTCPPCVESGEHCTEVDGPSGAVELCFDETALAGTGGAGGASGHTGGTTHSAGAEEAGSEQGVAGTPNETAGANTGGKGNTGGRTSTGGKASTGGQATTVGEAGSGEPSGGAQGTTGGNTGTGGNTSTGGSPAAAGAAGAGETGGSGGTSGTGGSGGTSGTGGSGGMSGTGGSGGTGGACSGCFIGGTCHAADTPDPSNGCRSCQPGESTNSWSPVADDTPCDDATVCNGRETCQAGSCTAGTALNCEDDGDPCTSAFCDDDTGCGTEFTTAACDDEDETTVDDVCNGAGTCAGLADVDGDGIADEGYDDVCASGETTGCNDSCPGVPNADQLDANGNGVGNACDAGTLTNQYLVSHVWSPDSSRIAVVRCPAGQGWSCDLIVADPDLTHARIISKVASSSGLSDWKGDWILFQKWTTNGQPSTYDRDGEYWKIRPDGRDLTQITFVYTNGIKTTNGNPGYANAGTARWARFVPGSGLVYFYANNGNGWYSTFVCNDDGTDQWQRISPASQGWSAAVSPGGGRLVYGDASNYNVAMNLTSVTVAGTDPVVVHTGLLPGYDYNVSPDGATLAYVQDGTDGTVIRLVDMDGTNDRALVDPDAVSGEQRLLYFVDSADAVRYGSIGYWQPFSPDSKQVVFSVSDTDAGVSHIYQVGRDGTALTQVSSGATYDYMPQFSPDGQYISFHRVPNTTDTSVWPPPSQLVIVPATTGYEEVDNSYINGHMWSPDSHRIAFVKCPSGQSWSCDLMVSDPDFGRAQTISSMVSAGGVTDWKGDWILFQKWDTEGQPAHADYDEDGEFWKIRPDGRDLTQVTYVYTDGITTVFSNPGWAGAGTARDARFVPGAGLVYFKANDGNGWWSMFVCNDDGTDDWAYVSTAQHGWNGAVSPAGDRLVYSYGTNYNQPMDLTSVDLTGHDPVVVKYDLDASYAYDISDDGTTLAYVDNGTAGTVIRLVDMDGTDDRALTNSAALPGEHRLRAFVDTSGTIRWGAGYSHPFSPDSAKVLFSVSDTTLGESHIYQIGSNGSGLTQVTSGPVYDGVPRFSPNGQYISLQRMPSSADTSLSPAPTELVIVAAP